MYTVVIQVCVHSEYPQQPHVTKGITMCTAMRDMPATTKHRWHFAGDTIVNAGYPH